MNLPDACDKNLRRAPVDLMPAASDVQTKAGLVVGTRSVVSVFAERNIDAEEAESLAGLPSDGTRLSKVRRVALDDRTAKSNVLRGQFSDCFECAWVSLTSCGLVNSNDVPAATGAGAQLLGRET